MLDSVCVQHTVEDETEEVVISAEGGVESVRVQNKRCEGSVRAEFYVRSVRVMASGEVELSAEHAAGRLGRGCTQSVVGAEVSLCAGTGRAH